MTTTVDTALDPMLVRNPRAIFEARKPGRS